MVDKGGFNFSSGDGDESGAQYKVKYHKLTHDVVGVPVIDIKDSISSAVEEVAQFSIGNFLASGAFWLGTERLIINGYKDVLFLSCIAFFVCGVVLAITGFRQALRRVTRLSRYIPNDKLT